MEQGAENYSQEKGLILSERDHKIINSSLRYLGFRRKGETKDILKKRGALKKESGGKRTGRKEKDA